MTGNEIAGLSTLRERARFFETGSLRWVPRWPVESGEGCLLVDGTSSGERFRVSTRQEAALRKVIGCRGRMGLIHWNDSRRSVRTIIRALRAAADLLGELE
jgi:hypothetical protein